MKKSYEILKNTVEYIIKDSFDNLKEEKGKLSPSGAWDCYVKIYADDIQVDDSCIDYLENNIRRAYNKAKNIVTVNIYCYPGMKAPSPQPSFGMR